MYQTFSKQEISDALYIRLRMIGHEELRQLCDQLADVFLTLDDVAQMSRIVVATGGDSDA